jgi:hypothetical protein
MCGRTSVLGKSYCEEHVVRVYLGGTALTGRRKQRAIERELKDLERREDIADMENEDV